MLRRPAAEHAGCSHARTNGKRKQTKLFMQCEKISSSPVHCLHDPRRFVMNDPRRTSTKTIGPNCSRNGHPPRPDFAAHDKLARTVGMMMRPVPTATTSTDCTISSPSSSVMPWICHDDAHARQSSSARDTARRQSYPPLFIVSFADMSVCACVRV